MNTLKETVSIIEKFCDNHPQINKYVYGDFNVINQDKDFKPVICEVFASGASNTDKLFTTDIAVGFYDKCKEDYSNLLDIHSKTLQIANDLINDFVNGNGTYTTFGREEEIRQNYQVETTSFEPIYNQKNDRLQGFAIVFSVTIFNDQSACNL